MLKEIIVSHVSVNVKYVYMWLKDYIFNTHIFSKISNISLRNISSIVNGTENWISEFPRRLCVLFVVEMVQWSDKSRP